jgi:hypothetical protein
MAPLLGDPVDGVAFAAVSSMGQLRGNGRLPAIVSSVRTAGSTRSESGRNCTHTLRSPKLAKSRRQQLRLT